MFFQLCSLSNIKELCSVDNTAVIMSPGECDSKSDEFVDISSSQLSPDVLPPPSSAVCFFIPPYLYQRLSVCHLLSEQHRATAHQSYLIQQSLAASRLAAAARQSSLFWLCKPIFIQLPWVPHVPAPVPTPKPPPPPPVHPPFLRFVYTHGNLDTDPLSDTGLPGTLVRYEGQPAVTNFLFDASPVNEAYDNLGKVASFFRTVYGRNSLDNQGGNINATVHFCRNFGNAQWHPNAAGITFGDGDIFYKKFTNALDVIGHEFTHGIVEYTSKLHYNGESGGINEHLADVFGLMLVHHSKNHNVTNCTWKIGEGFHVPPVTGSIRDMKSPGDAYNDTRISGIGKDPQVSHYSNFYRGNDPNFGCHVNSGILNHAFYLAATALGGHSWEVTGKVWYDTMVDPGLRSDATFHGFATLLLQNAAIHGVDVQHKIKTALVHVGVIEGNFDIPARIHLRSLHDVDERAQGALNGIAGYDLRSKRDRIIAFDYEHSGKLDHLILYRPGAGKFYIIKLVDGIFKIIRQSESGVGECDLMSEHDRIFPFDFDHSNRLDHLVIYRPGTGNFTILKNKQSNFITVTKGLGLGPRLDLKGSDDRIFAFDYEGIGKLDHLAAYRPGSGTFVIIKNLRGNLSYVYNSTTGIGDLDFKNPLDRAFAIDFTGKCRRDHLVVARPGANYSILQNNNGTFSKVGGNALFEVYKDILAYDYDGSGREDHVLAYAAGPGNFIIQKFKGAANASTVFYAEKKLGDYDFTSPDDKVVPFDMLSDGSISDLVVYRPGEGIFRIMRNESFRLG
jgi:hypothetical protein